MKSNKLTVLMVLIVCLTAWGVTAYEPDVDNSFFDEERQLSMIQEQLALTDEQTVAVQGIVAAAKEAMAEIIISHGLHWGDMRKMHQELKKFSKQDLGKLAAILNRRQLQALRKEILANGSIGFMPLAEKEKLTCLQKILGLSDEKATQVATILEQGEVQREKVLESLDLNSALMMAFYQDMTNCKREMTKGLSEVLAEKQIDQFEWLGNQMNLKADDLTIHSCTKENCYDA